MTKKRILFVDDEPLVLQGLHRMLRSMRAEWDMEFVMSGKEALAVMGERPFDVVVSDMRMPEMNGAQLLNEVMRHFPKTVRLILSGHADREMILRCVGSTHQFLAKPCDPDALRETVRRASRLEETLESEAIRSVVAGLTRIPSVPSLYMKIVDMLQMPDVMLEDIGKLVAQDIGMTAQILKLVNSAFFGLPRQMTDVVEAVTYIGLDTIKALVLSIHAFSQFEQNSLGSLSLATVWDHSFKTACAARSIARMVDGGNRIADDAFVSGLLHDAGKLVLAANSTLRYKEAVAVARSRKSEIWQGESEVFGANHAGIGGYLLGLWGLPVPVVEAISLHHSPLLAVGTGFNPLAAVHIANGVISANQPDDGMGKPELNKEFLAGLGLNLEIQFWRNELLAESAGVDL